MTSNTDNRIGDDILHGASAIAEFMFGDKTKRRSVYHLAETERLPIFRLGMTVCGRKSTLLDWIAEQEKRGMQGLKKRVMEVV